MLTTTKRFLSNACAAAAVFTLAAALWHVPKVQAQTPSQLKQLTTWYTAMDGSDGTVELLSDQISYLLAGHATRGGAGLSEHFIEHEELKGTYARGWRNSGQSFTWNVTSANAETYHIYLLMNGRQNVEVQVQVGSSTNTVKHTFTANGWGRHSIGSVAIPKGTSTFTLKSNTASHGEMWLKSIELKPDSAKAAIDRAIADAHSKSDWIKGKVGAMFQWGPWGGYSDGRSASFPSVYADFDYIAFAQTMSDMRVDYVIWSTSWWQYWFPAPIAAIDAVQTGITTSSHGSQDYLRKLIDALKAKNIKLFLYYHSGHSAHKDAHNTVWWSNFWKAPQAGHYARKEGAINRWMNITAEIGNRYGEDLGGWFFDDGSQYYPAPFHLVNRALRAGNPNRYVNFNEWVDAQGPTITEYADTSFGNGVADGASFDRFIDRATGKFNSGPWSGVYSHFMQTVNGPGAWGILGGRTTAIPVQTTEATFTSEMTRARTLNKALSYNFLMWADGSMPQTGIDRFKNAKTIADTTASSMVNNTDSAITYSGNWTHQASPNRSWAYKKDASYTNTNGASFEYTFTGTGIDFISEKHSAQGDVEIFINNVSKGIVSANQNTGRLTQHVLYRIRGLSPGSHTIKVVNRSSQYMIVDALRVITWATPRYDMVNNTDSAITYSGNWTHQASPNRSWAYERDASYTNTSGASFEYTFTGTGIDFISEKHSAQGNVEIFIDNVSKGIVSANQNTGRLTQHVLYRIRGLSPGSHTIKVVNRSSQYMIVDALRVLTWATPLHDMVNNTDSAITYSGNWTHQASPNRSWAYEKDASYTNTSGASFEYTFTGTGIDFISEKHSAQGDVEIFIDNVSKGIVSANQRTGRLTQHVLYRIRGLSSGSHTIKVINRSSQWMVVDALRVITGGVPHHDTVAPQPAISAPDDHGGGSFTATFTFDERVTGFTASDIGVTGGTAGNFTGSGATYTATITPTQTSTNVVLVVLNVAAGVATDKAGNGNTAAARTVRVDNTPPTATINAPGAHNGSAFTATFTFSRPVMLDCCINYAQGDLALTFIFSKPVTGFNAVGVINVTGARILSFSGAGATYTATIRPNDIVGEDDNADIQYFANVALNVAGGAVANDTTAIVRFDGIRPTVNIAVPATHNGSAFDTTFTFSETVTGFTADDIGVRGGSVSNLTGTGRLYTATITPTDGDTYVRLWLNASSVEDVAGNGNSATGRTIPADTGSPTPVGPSIPADTAP